MCFGALYSREGGSRARGRAEWDGILFGFSCDSKCSTLKRSSIIVDDDVSVRESLTELFTDFGLSVRSAEDGSSALFEIRQEVPDIILSDLNMPRMSGCEFLSLVRRRFPAIRVIAMSGAFSRRRYTARDCRGRFL